MRYKRRDFWKLGKEVKMKVHIQRNHFRCRLSMAQMDPMWTHLIYPKMDPPSFSQFSWQKFLPRKPALILVNTNRRKLFKVPYKSDP